jgi:hypothetical protein
MKDKAAGHSEPMGPPSEEPESPLLELLVTESPPAVPSRIDGVVVGRLAGFAAGGAPLVEFNGNPAGTPIEARSTLPLSPEDVGSEIALLFEGGDSQRPISIGRMHVPAASTNVVKVSAPPQVERDGERLVFSAEREIVLKCGDASITLTRAGKILIRGAYLLARSSGVNRIQGGSVEIN